MISSFIIFNVILMMFPFTSLFKKKYLLTLYLFILQISNKFENFDCLPLSPVLSNRYTIVSFKD